MRPTIDRWLLAALLPLALPVQAEVTSYTSQFRFMRALASQGLTVQRETFERNAVWGDVRSTIVDGFHAAPAIVSQGITWTANFGGGEITTGDGAARRGSWGFYAYPHGQYGSGADCSRPGVCGDGFAGEASQGLFAIGGWIRTNTPPADLNLFLDFGPDRVRIDYGDDGMLGTGYAFFGAISSTAFDRFEFREMEGSGDEAKFIFADDFRFSLAPVPASTVSTAMLSPVPEPTVAALMLLGLLSVGVSVRRSLSRR